MFVGQCGLQPVARTGPEVELAYHFNKASWNKGYATEAAIAVLAHGLGPASLDHVIALVFPENVGSCRVAEKAGMHFEGTTDVYYEMPGLRNYSAERDQLARSLRLTVTRAHRAASAWSGTSRRAGAPCLARPTRRPDVPRVVPSRVRSGTNSSHGLHPVRPLKSAWVLARSRIVVRLWLCSRHDPNRIPTSVGVAASRGSGLV